ncbi:hypothetical protein [Streptomyces sp. NPDC048282]|uniref:hypothetical protein n=1 Tax=Streptomyces sp. NPDC048282 TaxID=3365528 RepID=UPI0037117A06
MIFSRRARRRAPTSKEQAIAVGELREKLAAAGCTPDEVDVQVQTPHSDVDIRNGSSLDEHRQHLGELAEAGGTRFVVRASARHVAQACDDLAAYGRDVIAHAR